MTSIRFVLSPHGWRVLFVLALLIPALPACAQRVALLVGNADYSVGRLTNPPHDVAAMEKALVALGFKVQKVLNANQNQMKRAVRDFGTSAQGAEVAFVYYSGHGTQVNGENYLLPVGASIEKESDYEVEAVSANAVLAQIRGAQPKAAILVLDACRDNPLAAVTKSATKGLGRMSAPTGTMIAFATAPGDTASDNGHYARVLAREIQKPGQELVDVFRNTAAEVRRLSASGKVQDPRISEMSINERLYLAGPGTQVASMGAQAPEAPNKPSGGAMSRWVVSRDDLLMKSLIVSAQAVGDKYELTLEGNYPEKDSKGNPLRPANYINFWGQQWVKSEWIYLKSIEKKFDGDWKAGESFSVKVTLPADFFNSNENYNVRICIGDSTGCYPSPNIFGERLKRP